MKGWFNSNSDSLMFSTAFQIRHQYHKAATRCCFNYRNKKVSLVHFRIFSHIFNDNILQIKIEGGDEAVHEGRSGLGDRSGFSKTGRKLLSSRQARVWCTDPHLVSSNPAALHRARRISSYQSWCF
jgi:hypothetical protein